MGDFKVMEIDNGFSCCWWSCGWKGTGGLVGGSGWLCCAGYGVNVLSVAWSIGTGMGSCKNVIGCFIRW